MHLLALTTDQQRRGRRGAFVLLRVFCALSISLLTFAPLSAQSIDPPLPATQANVSEGGRAKNGADPEPNSLGDFSQGSDVTSQAFLGAGDQVELSVVIWGDIELEYRIWEPVSGIYTVSANGSLTLPLVGTVSSNGSLTLPLVGSIPAIRLSRAELSRKIAAILHTRAQLVEPPVVTMNVVTYAPFFVLGDVARPGAFEARPERTVYQAFALAGGTPRITGGLDVNVRSLMVDSGVLAQLHREIVRAQASEARYLAMLNGVEVIELPEPVQHPDGAAALDRLIEGEQLQLNARRDAMALEVKNLEGLKTLLDTEIESLEEKLDGLSVQISLAQENLDNMLALKESGLARSVQIRDAQEALFVVKSQQIDIETGIYRARQRKQETDRDILALRSHDKVEAARELQVLQGKMEELRLRRATFATLVEASGGEASILVDQAVTYYFLTRKEDMTRELQVLPDTVIGRGDVLRVERVFPELTKQTDSLSRVDALK